MRLRSARPLAPRLALAPLSACAARATPSADPEDAASRSAASWRGTSSRYVPISSPRNSRSPPVLSRTSAMTAWSTAGSATSGTGRHRLAAALEGAGELLDADRLAEVVVHPRGEACIAVVAQRVRRHGHDARSAVGPAA